MEEARNGGGKRYALALVLGVIVAALNIALLLRTVVGDWSFLQQGSATPLTETLRTQLQANPAGAAFLIAAPVVLALLVAALGGGPAAAAPQPEAPAKPGREGEDAMRLLRLLQEDARFIDFIQEDLDGYDDAQVGAATRSIHAGCRKALEGRVVLRRIYDSDEGSTVTIEPGFDPARVRLSGNVGAAPPFSGALQHAGWYAAEVKLPESPGAFDVAIIAPAEVEIA
jgi:hypothetical protein